MNGERKTENGQAVPEGRFQDQVRALFGFILHTTFHVRRGGREVLAVPTWLPVIFLPCFWGLILPALLIALFCECRYSFSGRADVSAANQFCDKAGSFADGVRSGMQGKE